MKRATTFRWPWLRYSVFGALLLATWLLLWESVSPGALLLGLAFAAGGVAALAALRMPAATMRRLDVIPGLLRDVAVEVVRSNNAVARIILARGEGPLAGRERRSGFVEVRLDMRSPHGLAALACILTATPGTVWVDHDPETGVMLLHVLDLVDEESWVRIIKDKWERRLMAIFE
jgi:multicomponent K+:H+ antiporter subunit E